MSVSKPVESVFRRGDCMSHLERETKEWFITLLEQAKVEKLGLGPSLSYTFVSLKAITVKGSLVEYDWFCAKPKL